MTALALLAAIAAFALFALSTDAHALTRLRSRPGPTTRRTRRAGAWALLMVTFVAIVGARGWVFGPIVWIAVVMFAAGVVFLALNLLPPSLRIKE